MPYDLFELCKKENAQAQRMLFDLYKARLMGLSRRYARNREEAQDILQEAFIKIFTRFHQLETSDKMESWMKTVVVNTAISHYHKHKVRHELMVNHTDLEEDDRFLHPDHLSDVFLLSLVNSLPDGCRIVFNLYAIEGYSHTEIAAMLGVTEGTSRSQYHHAKTLLKQKLKCHNLKHYYEKFA
jgi:RNA polymerase sigma-70 factor (ECF subfamily)